MNTFAWQAVPSAEMITAMERAYAEATGVDWSKLHINHRAGLAAVFALILQEQRTDCQERVR